MIVSQPIFRFLGVIFDGDHDFEGLRSPRAHLDTVLRNLSRHLGTPRRPLTRLQSKSRLLACNVCQVGGSQHRAQRPPRIIKQLVEKNTSQDRGVRHMPPPGVICHGCHMTVPRWHMTRVSYDGTRWHMPRVSYDGTRWHICHGCHMTVPGWHMPPILCKTCLEASRTRTALA